MPTRAGEKQLLIVGLHPRFLEKPVFWFEKNMRSILRARVINSFWQKNSLLIWPTKAEKLSLLLRRFHDLGYAKVQTLTHPGEFIHQGGDITLFPINKTCPWRIELVGNAIDAIEPVTLQNPENEPSWKKNLLKKSGLPFLSLGDFVVHVDHGIGRYTGIIERDDKPYLVIEYAAGDALYVPEEIEERMAPYIGFRTPIIHRLGTPLWNKTKKKVKEDIIAFARELIKQYAHRSVAERTPHAGDTALEEELVSSFEHRETPDQRRACEEVLKDMGGEIPMDRLLLGDVGFGKTEVALRASLRAVASGRQVALISPTTVLSDQHAETFTRRLGPLGVIVERLSRLETEAKQKHIAKQIAAGAVDIVIGTHRLFSKDIQFKNMGLLIVDEEQRFGVKQKEQLKKGGVDVLSLSATPIPRTLHLAMSNLRPMSVIATPPAFRKAPKTFILPFSKQTIQNALAVELERGGQAYVLSNNIRGLPLLKALTGTLLPHARSSVIHGRMKEADIVRTMHEFREQKIDILLSTTIIENGLDISNANTLIVCDASEIGLAQAHQLRGRIGRGETQAYAYFLYLSKEPKEKAARRLDALFRTQYLGAGQDLALRDMEIRGAGNILGRDQSGRVNQIGLNLYCQMLAEAVEELRSAPDVRKT